MKTHIFLKVFLCIVCSFILSCDQTLTNSNQVPEKILEIVINQAKEECSTNKWECKDFKVSSSKKDVLDDADKANEIIERWIVTIKYLKRINPQSNWEMDYCGGGYEIKKDGKIQQKGIRLLC